MSFDTVVLQVVITRLATGGYDIYLTCPAKEPEGFEVHAFGKTGHTPFIQIQQTQNGLPNADINNGILNGREKKSEIYYMASDEI